MEIQSPHYQPNMTKKCKDIYNEYLLPVVREFSEIAKFYMSSEVSDDVTMKINAAICDMLKFHHKYRELPLYLVAEAFHKGALGQLGGTTRYTVRNVVTWLEEMYTKMSNFSQQEQSKVDSERRKEEEKTYKQGQRHHTKFGTALYHKMEWAQSGLLTEEEWDRITLDKIVDMMDRGYPIAEMDPGMIL